MLGLRLGDRVDRRWIAGAADGLWGVSAARCLLVAWCAKIATASPAIVADGAIVAGGSVASGSRLKRGSSRGELWVLQIWIPEIDFGKAIDGAVSDGDPGEPLFLEFGKR